MLGDEPHSAPEFSSHWISKTALWAGSINVPILQMRKLRHREVKYLVKWQACISPQSYCIGGRWDWSQVAAWRGLMDAPCGSCHYGIRCCVEVSGIQQSFHQWWNDHCFRSLWLRPPWGMKSGRIWTKMVWSCSLHFWPVWTGYAVSRGKPGDFREVSCCKEMIKVKINIM